VFTVDDEEEEEEEKGEEEEAEDEEEVKAKVLQNARMEKVFHRFIELSPQCLLLHVPL
jgi:hypothetical protein